MILLQGVSPAGQPQVGGGTRRTAGPPGPGRLLERIVILGPFSRPRLFRGTRRAVVPTESTLRVCAGESGGFFNLQSHGVQTVVSGWNWLQANQKD